MINVKKFSYKLSSFSINLSKQRQLRHNQQFLEISLWKIQTPWSADEATDGLKIDFQLSVTESFDSCCRKWGITTRPVTGFLSIEKRIRDQKKDFLVAAGGSICWDRTDNLWPADGRMVATRCQGSYLLSADTGLIFCDQLMAGRLPPWLSRNRSADAELMNCWY